MLQRFASAALVAVIALAIAAATAFVLPGISIQQLSPVLLAWCFAPCVWGLWAMAAPRSWVPHRLPPWGAILGLILGSFVILVLDMPRLVTGLSFSMGVRALIVVFVAAFYYILWSFVAAAYLRLSPQPASTPTQIAAKAA